MKKVIICALLALLAGCAVPSPSPEHSWYPLPSAAVEQMLEDGSRAEAQCAPLTPVLTVRGLECWTDAEMEAAQ